MRKFINMNFFYYKWRELLIETQFCIKKIQFISGIITSSVLLESPFLKMFINSYCFHMVSIAYKLQGVERLADLCLS